MQIIAMENACDRRHGMAGRRVSQAAFVVLCSCMLGSALYAARLVDRMQERELAEKWVVAASVLPHQIPTSIDSMFKR